ncbi:MAG: hypothetical protein HKN12_10440, partial [Gemmatimonadetes bacterium]|nr:hypothetical protein [Gemmatimonadota bacterium]
AEPEAETDGTPEAEAPADAEASPEPDETGTSAGEDTEADDDDAATADSTAADSTDTGPNLKKGREKAGLGFKDPNMVLHPYLGYVFRPRPPDAEGPFRIAISSDGFLDAKPLLRKRSPDKLLVGVTGGSVSGQLGSFHGDKLAAALKKLPEFAGKEPEFVWMGMPGYHQPQQLFQVGYLLAQGGELDVLINIDGFNEIAVPGALNAPFGAHPLFPMNWSMVALNVPDLDVQRSLGGIAFLKEERSLRAGRLHGSVWSHSPTRRVLWKLDDDRMAARIAQLAWEIQEFPEEEIPFFVRGPEDMHLPAEELIPACVEVWKRSSLQLKAICDAHNIRYVHCLQPNQYDPGSKPLSAEERDQAFDAEGPYKPVIEDGYPRFRQAGEELRAAGVEFHDLSQVFADERETVYVDSCCHFNGLGNAILADALSAAMRAYAGSS